MKKQPNERQALRPKTRNQEMYFDAILEPVNDKTGDAAYVFGIGAAGTGKTYVAACLAVELYKQGVYRELVITHPTVECGESLGALPGEMDEKFEPWVSAVLKVLIRELGPMEFKKQLHNTIHILPLQYMRGETFDQSFIIVDEAQNLTKEQVKMAMTRVGVDSKMVFCGDDDQTDVDPRDSGLIWIVNELHRQCVSGIEIINFTDKDNVRSAASKKSLGIFKAAN